MDVVAAGRPMSRHLRHAPGKDEAHDPVGSFGAGVRVRLVRQPDGVSRGMSAARALGVRASQGDLIGFLDADDVWLPEKIIEQVAALEANPGAGMVYGRTQMWHSWDADAVRSDHGFDLGVEPDRLYPPPQLLPQLLENRAQTPTTCNALIRRAAYEEAGGFEEAFPGLYEDQVFFANMILMDSESGNAYCLGRTYITTKAKPKPVSRHALGMIVR